VEVKNHFEKPMNVFWSWLAAFLIDSQREEEVEEKKEDQTSVWRKSKVEIISEKVSFVAPFYMDMEADSSKKVHL